MKSISVLIVDDNEVDRYILKRQLNDIGVCDVFESDDGSSALDYLGNYEKNRKIHGKKFPPVVIFLDINMPIVGGFEFLTKFAELRNQVALTSCVIMMYSSSEHPEDRDKIAHFDFVKGYISKGQVKLAELEQQLREIGKQSLIH